MDFHDTSDRKANDFVSEVTPKAGYFMLGCINLRIVLTLSSSLSASSKGFLRILGSVVVRSILYYCKIMLKVSNRG
jgi:hypothetical protein